MFEETLLGNINKEKHDFFVAIGKDQWQHHFQESNYLKASMFSNDQLKENWNKHRFLKLALQFSLSNWNNTASSIEEGYLKIATVLL